MRLIDADATIYALNVASRGDSKDVIRNLVICFLLASPTVDAIPVSFIKEQIDKLQGIADYEFIESGGYLGECNHELRALQDLLKHWAERKEE